MSELANFINSVVAHHDQLLASHQYERELRRNEWLQPAMHSSLHATREDGERPSPTGFMEDQSPTRICGLTGDAIPKPPLVVQVLGENDWKQSYAAAMRERPEVAGLIDSLFDACNRLRNAVGEAASEGRRLNYDGDAAALAEFGDVCDKLGRHLTPPEQKRTADGKTIPPSNRTRPMTLGEAAKHLGRTGSKKDAAKWMRACIDDGEYTVEEKTRQSFIFDKSQFPEVVWAKILPR